MSRNAFWSGVATGAAGTVAGLWAWGLLAPLGRMVRVERSIQIARPAVEVFSAFARVERIPQLVRSVVSVVSSDDVSVWMAEIAGRRFEWDVEIVQVVPKQVIGWKSFRGPKHSGRISFFALGDDTLVHVGMNYLPGIRLFNGAVFWNLGDAIEAALHDSKTTLESARSRWAIVPPTETYEALRDQQATGTYGHGPVQPMHGHKEPDPIQNFNRPSQSDGDDPAE